MRLYGKNTVLERLKVNPRSISRIYVQEGQADAAYIYKKAKKWGIPVATVPKTKLIKLSRNHNTQGILVDVEDFAYTPYEDLLESSFQKKKSLLFLDNLSDPQNLGSIIRSLACLGNFGIVLPTHDSVDVTEAVLRVASGGDNYVPVSRVANLAQAITKAKEMGYWIAGGVVGDGQMLTKTEIPFPVALVMGSEQKGIRDVIRKTLDLPLSIEMAYERMSLNVAQATAILCYEITKQKENKRG